MLPPRARRSYKSMFIEMGLYASSLSITRRTLLSDNPDIVIATPSRALALVQAKTLSLALLDTLVIDEADLILSYGHDADIRVLLSGGHLPRIFQSFLMSATMTESVEALKGLALRNPAILKPLGIDVKVDLPGVGENYQGE